MKNLVLLELPQEINQSIIEKIVKEKKVPVIAPLG
jgi:acetylglutamate kinase